MPHYAKCDVISWQNKKFVNKTFERKTIKELVLQFSKTFKKVLSHNAVKIFVS